MKIAHLADIHLGELPGPVKNGANLRLMDTVRCMDYAAAALIEEKPDAILISGDLFHKAKLWGDQILGEISFAAEWLHELGSIAPTVLMFGTANHDNENAFENLASMHIPNVNVLTHPSVIAIKTRAGLLRVAAVPGFDKGYFRALHPGMAPEEENVRCSAALGDIILGLGVEGIEYMPGTPCVLMSHYTVVGCELDNGDHVFAQSDVVLPREALEASAFDLVCLGHIHRAQRLDTQKPVYYSGSLNAISFNEEGQKKGFWIHELGAESQFIEVPARRFQTLTCDLDELSGTPDQLTTVTGLDSIQEAIVRLHYTCSEETQKQLDRKALERQLYDAGAFYVAEIKPVEIRTGVVRRLLDENAGPLDNLIAWAGAEGKTREEAEQLAELARPFLSTVAAGAPTGRLTGVFEPRCLEVRNYRSYLQESFDFGPIYFATVNGPNGIGKSAFFMDAICDALYEEPRSGQTGSWITRGQDEGSITFEFAMGENIWRVARNRSIKGSGKVTLSLQEQVDGQWVDRSADRARDTQERIQQLLGMDVATFRCVALIMQDAYGLFLEADKTERMEVLANILGLGVYEQLAELAKARVTELNRELTATKGQLALLADRVRQVSVTRERLHEARQVLEACEQQAARLASEALDMESTVRRLSEAEADARKTSEQVDAQKGLIQANRAGHERLRITLEKAQKLLRSEAQIAAHVAEHEELKTARIALQTRLARLPELSADILSVEQDLADVGRSLSGLDAKVIPLRGLLDKSENLRQKALLHKQMLQELEAMDATERRHEAIGAQIKDKQHEREIEQTSLQNRSQRLQRELRDLETKAAMLADSNCIDAGSAACRFLADAKLANEQIPSTRRTLETLDWTGLDKLATQIEQLSEAQIALSYDPREHQRVRELVQVLSPAAEQAAQLDGKAELLASLQAQASQLASRREKLLSRQADLKEQRAQLQEVNRELQTLDARLTKLEPWVKAKESLPAARTAEEMATGRITQLDTELLALSCRFAELEARVVELLANSVELASSQATLVELREQLKAAQTAERSQHAEIGALEAGLTALEQDQEKHRQLTSEAQGLASQVVQYQTLVTAFGFDGIPFMIVRSVVPELSTMANEILGQMTGGRMALDMRTERLQRNKREVNALEIWITDWRGNIPYKDRSGGQKVKAALANAFALADLKARRAGIQLGFMFVDEPPFLDAEGIEAYCDALQLLSQRYPKMRVIAISHDPRMKARFPQQIDVVDMGDQGSRVMIA